MNSFEKSQATLVLQKLEYEVKISAEQLRKAEIETETANVVLQSTKAQAEKMLGKRF